jgi:hypothetical protein
VQLKEPFNIRYEYEFIVSSYLLKNIYMLGYIWYFRFKMCYSKIYVLWMPIY